MGVITLKTILSRGELITYDVEIFFHHDSMQYPQPDLGFLNCYSVIKSMNQSVNTFFHSQHSLSEAQTLFLNHFRKSPTRSWIFPRAIAEIKY